MMITVTVDCTEHGRMAYHAGRMLWRCEACGRDLTVEDVQRFACAAKADAVPAA